MSLVTQASRRQRVAATARELFAGRHYYPGKKEKHMVPRIREPEACGRNELLLAILFLSVISVVKSLSCLSYFAVRLKSTPSAPATFITATAPSLSSTNCTKGSPSVSSRNTNVS